MLPNSSLAGTYYESDGNGTEHFVNDTFKKMNTKHKDDQTHNRDI